MTQESWTPLERAIFNHCQHEPNGDSERCECDAILRDVEEVIASIIAAHAEPLVALLRESRREHADGEDMICAADYAAPERGPCNCGAEAYNAKIDAVLAGNL